MAIRSLAGSLPRATLPSCIRKWQVALPQRTLTAVKTAGLTGAWTRIVAVSQLVATIVLVTPGLRLPLVFFLTRVDWGF